ncbi:unnamed protein product [Ectocarpus sp. 13 AM-2016]
MPHPYVHQCKLLCVFLRFLPEIFLSRAGTAIPSLCNQLTEMNRRRSRSRSRSRSGNVSRSKVSGAGQNSKNTLNSNAKINFTIHAISQRHTSSQQHNTYPRPNLWSHCLFQRTEGCEGVPILVKVNRRIPCESGPPEHSPPAEFTLN